MIFITQLIFIKDEQAILFEEFESFAIPLMEKYGGKMLYRLRPKKEDFISGLGEFPYEIHLITFDSDDDLNSFMKDDSRLKFLHLKEASIKSRLLVKGIEMK